MNPFSLWIESLGLEFKRIPQYNDGDAYYDFKGSLGPGHVLRFGDGSGYDLVGDINTSLGSCGCCGRDLSDYDAYACLPFANGSEKKAA